LILFLVLTVLFSIITGYLWQRSGACTITGFRDLILFKNIHLIKTIIGIIIGLPIGILILLKFNQIYFYLPLNTNYLFNIHIALLFIAGSFGIGFFSIISNGCPLKHHVGITKGVGFSIFYIIGFYSGFILCYFFYLFFITF